MMIKHATIFLLLITTTFPIISTNATRFDILNKCPHTVWAASFPTGGGQRLDSGQTWTIDVPAGTKGCRIWGRTGCTFDRSGLGRCETGDCDGLLECQTLGLPPNTLSRISLSVFQGQDFFDVSVVEGFNLPVEFSPSPGLSNCTRGPSCTTDIIGRCPSELRTPGGCNNGCTVFGTSEYCCTGRSCGPTDYSRFFKRECPEAYSYPTDNTNDTIYQCPGGTSYRVVFCP